LSTCRILLLLASLPIRVLLRLLAALQFYLPLLFSALLLLGALLVLILLDALAILLLALPLLFLILIDTLAILLPSVLLLRALLLLILLRCALRLALPLLFGTLLTGLLLLSLAAITLGLLRLLCLPTLLLLRSATLLLLSPALSPAILICLFLTWLIRLLGLASLLPTFFSAAAAALCTCDVAGADQHCESKRCRRCEALVINFHLFTPLNLVAPSRLTHYQHWQAAFQGVKSLDGQKYRS
jgi:hypothetical protein